MSAACLTTDGRGHQSGEQTRGEHWRRVRIHENSAALPSRLGQTHTRVHGAPTQRSSTYLPHDLYTFIGPFGTHTFFGSKRKIIKRTSCVLGVVVAGSRGRTLALGSGQKIVGSQGCVAVG